MFSNSKRMILAATIAILSQSVAMAGVPEKFDSKQWVAMLNEVAQKGKTMVIGEGQAFRVLSNVTPNDTTKARQAEYMSLMGAINEQNEFNVYGVSTVSENWTIDANGNWVINVSDNAAADTGSVRAFSLIFNSGN